MKTVLKNKTCTYTRCSIIPHQPPEKQVFSRKKA